MKLELLLSLPPGIVLVLMKIECLIDCAFVLVNRVLIFFFFRKMGQMTCFSENWHKCVTRFCLDSIFTVLFSWTWTFSSLFLSKDRIKWSTWNTLRSRIWCKTLQDVGNISASILDYIIIFLNHHIFLVDLHRTNTYFTSSRSQHIKTSSSLHEVSHSRSSCIRGYTEHPKVSSDTIHSHSIGLLLSSPNGNSFWHCICFCIFDIPWF